MTSHYDDPAGARVEGLRDAARAAAEQLGVDGVVLLGEILSEVNAGLEGVEAGDLADAEEIVRTQLEAFLRRLQVLMENHPGPVPTTELDLPSDARFLRDMAEYLTRKYGLEDAP
ncbi:hypothetical protein BH24GEM2_BH24GEM2_04480 [soil metagenome]